MLHSSDGKVTFCAASDFGEVSWTSDLKGPEVPQVSGPRKSNLLVHVWNRPIGLHLTSVFFSECLSFSSFCINSPRKVESMMGFVCSSFCSEDFPSVHRVLARVVGGFPLSGD